MCFQDSSETWTRPSTPPRSTNAPKLTIEDDDTGADLALLELLEEGRADLGLRLLEPRTARQDHVVAVLVELDDLGLDLLADVRLEVADAAHLDERGREEATQADVEDEATLDDLDDGAGDDAVLLLDLLDRAPGALVLRTLLGQDQAAFLVLLLEDEGLDLVADVDDLVGVDVVLDGQLARGDDALGLVADVEQDLVPVDLDDATLDDVAVVEVLDRRVDRGEEVFLRADVVDGDLRGGLLDRAGSHVVGTPIVDRWIVDGTAHAERPVTLGGCCRCAPAPEHGHAKRAHGCARPDYRCRLREVKKREGMPLSGFAQVSRRMAGAEETAAANRSWWDARGRRLLRRARRLPRRRRLRLGARGLAEAELDLLGRCRAA